MCLVCIAITAIPIKLSKFLQHSFEFILINFPLITKVIEKSLFLEGIPLDERKSFDNVFAENIDVINADLEFVDDTSFDVTSYVGCTYCSNKRDYLVESVDNNVITVVDLLVKAALGLSIRQKFDIEDVLPFLQNVRFSSSTNQLTTNSVSEKIQNEIVEVKPDTISSYFEVKTGDFLYSSTEEQYRTKNERIADNIAAIKLVKAILAEDRKATSEEQETISKFSGWGGLDVVFDSENTYFTDLQGLLTPEEYAEAKFSILSAFYTPAQIISSIYEMLEKLNFKGGKILEIKTRYLIQFNAA